MDVQDAQSIANTYLESLGSNTGLELEFNLDITETHNAGFVFFYNTRKFWQTRDFMDSLAGNGPILITRDAGDVVKLPSNQSVEQSLAKLAQ